MHREIWRIRHKYKRQDAIHYHTFLQSCQHLQTKLNQKRALLWLPGTLPERHNPLRKQQPEGFRRLLFSRTCWLKQIRKRLHCSAVSAISELWGGGESEVREMGWPCCDVIHLLWLQGLSQAAVRVRGWVPPLWLSLRSELVHANYVAKGGIKETWAYTRWE